MRDLHLRRLWAINSLLISDLQQNVVRVPISSQFRCLCTCSRTNHTTNNDSSSKSSLLIRFLHLDHSNGVSFARATKIDGALEVSPTIDRVIPRSKEEREELQHHKPVHPPDARILRVSILGTPNAGKSTLTNKLMGWRICSVSQKVHTTKRNTKAVLMDGNTQILFVDTPGLISMAEKKKHSLEASMVHDPKLSIKKADLVIVLVDISNKWTRDSLDRKVMDLLRQSADKRTVLVLNKVDLVKNKGTLLELVKDLTMGRVGNEATHSVKKKSEPKSLEKIFKETEKLLAKQEEIRSEEDPEPTPGEEYPPNRTNSARRNGWPNFHRVFMLSALDGNGVEELKDYLLECAKVGPWIVNPNFVTDQTPEEIAIMAIREKLLDHLPKQIPYILDLEIEYWEVDASGVLRISMLIKCPTQNLVKIVIGGDGRTVSTIAEEARQMLMNTFRCEISLKLIVNYCKKK